MNLVVTGVTGFVGRNLVRRLLDEGHAVTAIIRSGSDTDSLPKSVDTHSHDDVRSLIEFFKANNFDGVIHLAAYCPAGHRSEDILPLIQSNIVFGTEVLEAAAEAGVSWFITTGSYMQHYGDENYSPSILYAATKQAFWDIARYWIDKKMMNIVALELFDNFGIGDTRKKIFALWRDALATGETVGMSPGEQIMDVSPVENVAAAFVHLATLLQKDTERTMNGRIFSLQSDNRMTLREWADLFAKIAQKSLYLEWGARPYRDREIMIPWTKGTPIPGYNPPVRIEDAIRAYLNDEK